MTRSVLFEDDVDHVHRSRNRRQPVAPVVQKVDSARFIQSIMQLVSELLIHRIVIYRVDSVIKLLNNRGKINRYPQDRDFSRG